MRATKQQYPSSTYRRLNALGICPEKRIGIGQDVVFALSFPPAERGIGGASGGGPYVRMHLQPLASLSEANRSPGIIPEDHQEQTNRPDVHEVCTDIDTYL